MSTLFHALTVRAIESDTTEAKIVSFAIPPELISADRRVLVTLRSDTFRPRDLDRASPDGRALGVMVERAKVSAP